VRMENWKKALIVGGLGYWSDTMDFAIALQVTPIIMSQWGLGAAIVGFVSAIGRVGTLLMSFFGGPIVDRFGRARMFAIGNFMSGLFYIFLAMTTEWVSYAVLRIGYLFFSMLTAYPVEVFIAEMVPAERRNLLRNVSTMMSVVGNLFLMLVGMPIMIPKWGWQSVFIFNGLFGWFVAAMGVAFLREPEVWTERMKLIKEGKLKESKVPLRRLLDKDVRGKFLLGCWGSFAHAFMMFPGWFIGTYAVYNLRWSSGTLGYFLAISTIVGALVAPLLGYISDRIGRTKTMTLGIIGEIIDIVLFLYGTSIEASMPFFGPTILYSVGGIFIGAWSNSFFVWRAEIYPTAVRASGTSFNHFFYALVDIFTALGLVGYLSSVIGLGSALALGCAIGIIGPIPILLSRVETKGRAIKAVE